MCRLAPIKVTMRGGAPPAAGGADRADAALERGDALLQDGDGRVADARVDEARLLEIEQRGGVVAVLEDEARL